MQDQLPLAPFADALPEAGATDQIGRQLGLLEVGAFYWTALAPEIVNSGQEELGSVSV